MHVNVEDLSSVKKILHIEISEDKVTREIDKAYQELKKTAKVKGFRPGKTPRAVLERHYKKDVDADVSALLIQESFAEVIQEKELNLIGTPHIDPPEVAYKQPYRYDATIEVRPTLDVIDFKEIFLKKPAHGMNEGEVEGQLRMLQRSLIRYEPILEDRPVQENDFVLISYEGLKGGESFEPAGKGDAYTMKVGDGRISAALDKGLVGMTKGEFREIPVSFPEDHENKALAGLDIVYKVTLTDIRQEVVPEIDDDFAKNFGKFETLDALTAEIRENLRQGYEKRIDQELNEQIFRILIEKSDFEVPDTMVEYELDGIITEAEQSFKYHNMTLEQVGMTHDSLREKYRDTAVAQVKRHLILGQIIDQEKLELTAEELDKGLEDMAKSFNQPVDAFKAYYKEKPESLEYFGHTLLEKKAVRLIIENSHIEEVAVGSQDEAGTEAAEAEA